MVTELDHDAIKEQIVTILQADSDLYNATGADGKVRVIEVGRPRTRNNKIVDTTLPHIWVTNSSGPFETITNTGSVVSDVPKALLHTFHYDIIIIVDSKSEQFSEEDLDDFQKLTLEPLEEDHDLGGTVMNSFPVRVDSFPHSGIQMSGMQGRKITLRCTQVTT
jgi:hypothetical protein